MTEKKLTPQHQRFCIEYMFDSNGSQAAIRSGVSPGMAGKRACTWLKWPEIQARIAELTVERSSRLQIEQDELARIWLEMLKVDINELVEFRRVNCRHCWGFDHAYHWTQSELDAAERRSVGRPDPVDSSGGTGFNPLGDPNPICPECAGEGKGHIFFKDTRNLSPAARRLYEGVSVGKDGTKMLTFSREKLHEMLARYLGMFKNTLEHTGPGGGPVQSVAISPDEFRTIAKQVADEV